MHVLPGMNARIFLQEVTYTHTHFYTLKYLFEKHYFLDTQYFSRRHRLSQKDSTIQRVRYTFSLKVPSRGQRLLLMTKTSQISVYISWAQVSSPMKKNLNLHLTHRQWNLIQVFVLQKKQLQKYFCQDDSSQSYKFHFNMDVI